MGGGVGLWVRSDCDLEWEECNHDVAKWMDGLDGWMVGCWLDGWMDGILDGWHRSSFGGKP